MSHNAPLAILYCAAAARTGVVGQPSAAQWMQKKKRKKLKKKKNENKNKNRVPVGR